MKNEEKNRKQQLTSLPISINILKVVLMAAGVYYFGVKFLFCHPFVVGSPSDTPFVLHYP